MPTTRITFEFTDAEGDKLTVPTYWDAANVDTVAKAQDAASDFETLVEACIGPVVSGMSVEFGLTHSTAETPDSGYSVFSGATLSFKDSDNVGQSLYFPGILQSQIANEIVIPTADPGMLQFLADISAGFGTGNHRISTRGSGALWSQYVIGKRSTRKP